MLSRCWSNDDDGEEGNVGSAGGRRNCVRNGERERKRGGGRSYREGEEERGREKESRRRVRESERMSD